MGFSTTKIDIEKALEITDDSFVDGEVVSASHTAYFHNDYWRNHVVEAEIKDDNKVIFFILDNSDFVEYKLKK